MAYIANPVTFDGTNDNLLRGGGLTSAVDGPNATVSFWLHRNTISTNQIIYSSQANRIEASINTSNLLSVFFQTSGGTITLRVQTTITDTANWHHVMMSGNGSSGHAYIDGVSVAPNVVAAGSVAWVRTNWSLGSSITSTLRLNGDLADLWLANVYIDLSNSANREKFRSAGGAPVDLGSTGEVPTGSQPIAFFSGATASWHTNKGTGGGFTLTGALTDGSLALPIDVITVTLTTSLEAVAQRQGLLADVSLDAASQAVFTLPTTLDATAQVSLAVSAGFDAAARAVITATATFDAATRKLLSILATFDALGEAGIVTRQVDAGLDALAQQRVALQTALDALGRLAGTLQTTLDAAAALPRSIAISLDALAVLISAHQVVATFEAAAQGRVSVSALLDTAAQKRLNTAATFDARSVLLKTISASLDAVARHARIVSATFEAAAQGSRIISTTVDAASQRSFAHTAAFDAVAGLVGVTSAAFDALAQRRMFAAAVFDAVSGEIRAPHRRVVYVPYPFEETVHVPRQGRTVQVRVPGMN